MASLIPMFRSSQAEPPPGLRLGVAAVGFAPVGLLAVHLVGAAPLSGTAPALAPVLVLVPLLVWFDPRWGRLLLVGLLAGVAATGPYDVFRLGCTAFGWFERDNIPGIGRALGLEPDWLWGYAWRYLGDGGGMGMAFAALGRRGATQGILFGLGVAGCLFVTLAVSEEAQLGLFDFNLATVAVAGLGHAIYGAGLGALMARWGEA